MNAVIGKQSNLEPYRIDLHGAFVPRTNLSGANLIEANFAGTDATGANFRAADFDRANLAGAILVGADLRGAKNLTIEQLSEAVLDETTLLPEYIDRDLLERAQAAKRA